MTARKPRSQESAGDPPSEEPVASRSRGFGRKKAPAKKPAHRPPGPAQRAGGSAGTARGKPRVRSRSPPAPEQGSHDAPLREIGELRAENRELRETLDAIRSGEVDAIIVPDGDRQKVYTLEGPDHPYRALVENIREGALTLSSTGLILYANARFAEMIGLPADRVCGTLLSDLVCPEYREGVVAAIAGIRNSPCRSRVRLHRQTGLIPVFLSMTPLMADTDLKISVVVTDRRRDEEQLLLQSRMLDAVADAVVATDPAGQIIYWNDAAEDLYGWPADEVLGKSYQITIPPGQEKSSRAIVRKLMQGTNWSGEIVVQDRSGRTFPIRSAGVPVFDDDRNLIAVLSASHDISERKAWEAALAEKNADLVNLNDELLAAGEELLRKNEELTATNEELAKSERRLRESEERFRSVLENSRDVIYRLNLQTGRYEYISPSVETVVGFPPEELMALDSETSLDLIHPEDRPAFQKLASCLDATGRAEIEYRQRAKNGEYRWLSNRMTLTRDEWGRPLYRTGNIRDITKRRIAEEALQESEERFRLAIRATNDAIWDLDIPTGTVQWNDTYSALYGRPPEASGKSRWWFDHIHPDDRERAATGFQAAIAGTATAWSCEYRFRRADGQWAHIHDRAYIAREGSGKAWRAIGAMQDLTEQKRAGDALRASEKRFRELAEKAGSIILSFNTQGRITYLNEFAERFFGFPRSEIIGKPAVGTIIPETETTGRDLRTMVKRIIENPLRYGSNENENQKKSGERVWIAWTNRPVYNADGTIREFTAIGIDITARKHAEIALQEKHEELNAAYEELGLQKQKIGETLAEKEILLSEIHHRVKNNLTAFISLLSLEGAYDGSPASIAMKNDLQNRARSMALIHETLYRTQNFSRVDMGLYLSTLASQIIRSYKRAEPVRILVESNGVSLDLMRATPAGLIVNELLTNAVKYAWPPGFDCLAARGEPPTIRIRLAPEDGSYVLTIRDNGIGLDAAIDPAATKTLGLKLVMFLSRHQLRAETTIERKDGTGFIFRLREAGDLLP